MSSENIKISVIIPTYNRSKLLNRSIRSVLNQTFQPNEIIVVDNGSTDDTRKMVSKNLQIKKGGISFKLEKLLKTESFIYIIILIAISLLLSLVTNLIFRKK